MKLLPSIALALLLAACATTPEDTVAANQRQLEKEARENFMALKARERQSSAPGSPAAPVSSLFRSARSKPIAPISRPETARPRDETIYLWNVPRRAEAKSARYLVYEKKYARALGKKPEDLSPEEREWFRRHYRESQ
jgi:hypothetical protein